MLELLMRRKSLHVKAGMVCFLLIVLIVVTWVGKENSAEVVSLWKMWADNEQLSVLYDQVDRAEAISMADADVCDNILHDDNSMQKMLNKMLAKSLAFLCGFIFAGLFISVIWRLGLMRGIGKSETHEDILSCIYCISYL